MSAGGSIDAFWAWVERGVTFRLEGKKFRTRVVRGNAIYPYPHVSVRRYADCIGEQWSYDLDECDVDSKVLTHLFRRFDRESYVPQEVAFRRPGGGWKRTVCKTRRAFDRALDLFAEHGYEVQTRDAEVKS